MRVNRPKSDKDRTQNNRTKQNTDQPDKSRIRQLSFFEAGYLLKKANLIYQRRKPCLQGERISEESGYPNNVVFFLGGGGKGPCG
jgi:hypothetical protein